MNKQEFTVPTPVGEVKIRLTEDIDYSNRDIIPRKYIETSFLLLGSTIEYQGDSYIIDGVFTIKKDGVVCWHVGEQECFRPILIGGWTHYDDWLNLELFIGEAIERWIAQNPKILELILAVRQFTGRKNR